MTTGEWPLRLIVRRSPPFLWGLAFAVGSMAAAVGLRMAFMGPDAALDLSSTYFPAFIVATIAAGWRWGGAMLAATLVVTQIFGNAVPGHWLVPILFTVSAAATIWVANALRDALLRLQVLRETEQTTREALTQSEARLELAQQVGRVGLWDYDVPHRRLHWSSGVYRNYGIARDRKPDFLEGLAQVHPDDRAGLEQFFRNALKGVAQPYEYRVIHSGGEVRWLLTRGEGRQDEGGRTVRLLGVNIDITERRLADQQVRESEARFRALADSTPILMWIARPDGTRTFVNRGYARFLGVPPEAAAAAKWSGRVHPDDLERVTAEHAAGEASRRLFITEARYQRVDGVYRWLRAYNHPHYGPNKTFEGFIGIGFDVSDAKQAEDDLKRINELLGDRVAAALAERDLAQAALLRAQKLEALGQLTGGVAHDFNNLLMVVTGALELIEKAPHDEVRRKRMLDAALGAARRGERLTQQLLVFSRRQPLKAELVRVDDLIAEVEPLLRQAVAETISLSVSLGAPEAVGLIDRSQFEAALLNLVVNARDASTSGGKIRIESKSVTLAAGQVESVEPGDYIQVSVHDTGLGMDAETLARAFEPFFTTKEIGKGTGLGLSQVYGFARQSGGGVSVESAPGQGCTVRLFLPLSAESAPQYPDTQSGPVDAAAPLTVLLVEDDSDVGAMVADMLAEQGHAVRRAEAAEPALEILRGGDEIDVVLTDLIMPGGLSGAELAREASTIRPGLPIILSSGYAGEALTSVEEAPWPLLRKPYTSEELNRMLQAVRQPLAETG